jgi:hypothetical protein
MPINTALFSNVPQAKIDPTAFDSSNALNRALLLSQYISQNELAQQKQAEAAALKNALASVDWSSPESVANLLRIPGGAAIAASAQQFMSGQKDKQKSEIGTRMAEFESVLARIQTPGEAQQWVLAVSRDPLLQPHMANIGFDPITEIGKIPQDPAGIAQWRLDMLATPESRRAEAKPVTVAAGASLMRPGTGEVIATAPLKPEFSETERITQQLQNPNLPPEQRTILQNRLNILTTREPKAPAERAPVAVIGEDGKAVFVSPSQALGKQPAATAQKPLTRSQELRLKKDMSDDQSTINNATTTAFELEKLTDELVGSPEKGIRPHPGLGGISGFQSYIPSMPTGAAKKAEQKLETFKGKIAAFGRQLASIEGKLGNMAVQEWKIVADSVQKIDAAAGNLDEQMRDVVRQAQNFANRLMKQYDVAYEDTPFYTPYSSTSAVSRPSPVAQIPGQTAAPAAPSGVPQDVWNAMTPQERALWQK